MKRLTEIIGPAPSELSLEEFLPRLRKERDRVLAGLEAFRNGTAPSWRELRDKNWKQKRADKAAKAAQKPARRKTAKKAKRVVKAEAKAEQLLDSASKLLADRVQSGALPLEQVAKSLNMTTEEARKWLKLPPTT
jgi:hypothetical protein